MKILTTPISQDDINALTVGDMVLICGTVFCGRDAALPKLVRDWENHQLSDKNIDLQGSVIFHTAVSIAGIGPTSSNKLEIETSIAPLSKAGVKIHLGKGSLSKETVLALQKTGSVYAVIPPVTALLADQTLTQKIAAYPELGMEAFYELSVQGFPAIIAAAHGTSIYDK